MKKWTVIMMYPEYAGDRPEGQELYIAKVLGNTHIEAASSAKREAYTANREDVNDPDDFRLLGVIPGHVNVFTRKRRLI